MVAATPAPEPAKAGSTAASTTPPEKTATTPKTAKTAKAPARAQAAPGQAYARQWFVQVGAFKDAAAAQRVAAKLRSEGYTVEESTRGGAATVAKVTTSGDEKTATGDRYDVVVSGQSPDELRTRLAGKNLTVEATSSGAVVRPSLPLRDAVALSKELAVDGAKVQVRRAGGGAAPARSAVASSAPGADGLHRVSVGGFADRAAAQAMLKELEAKGYKPFLTRR